jgi:hypothetical protein
MAKTENVKVEKGGILKYQEQCGLNRVYPMNGVPETQKRQLSSEEQSILSAPLIKYARKEEKPAE